MVRYGTWVVGHVTEKEDDFQITDENIPLLHLERKKKLNLSELTPQAAQAPAVRWLSCEIRFKVIFSDFLYLAVTYLSIFSSYAEFWLSPQARRIQTWRENTREYYTPMNSLLGYLWSNCFFFRQVFLLISHKARKAKWIEKRSVHSRPVKQIFLQYKITNCTHVVYTYFFFFWEGTVTNLAIWFVPHPVSIFLSLPTGHGNAFVSRQVHPNFRCHFS